MGVTQVMYRPNIDEKTLIYKTRNIIKCICTQCMFNVISTGTKKAIEITNCVTVCVSVLVFFTVTNKNKSMKSQGQMTRIKCS